MLQHGDIKTPVNMESCHIPKGWGEEIIIENNEMYCGKLLIFKKTKNEWDNSLMKKIVKFVSLSTRNGFLLTEIW